jgi:predicted amidohydrolase YtcJ
MAATRIFKNGKIYTVNKNQPWAEAVAVEGDKIVFVGDNDGAMKLADGNTEVTDLQGKMMMPGFIDGHVHPLMAAAFASAINLSPCENQQDVLDVVRDYVNANPDKEAYFGQGFADGMFKDFHPLADDLDAICADKPILLASSSCHGAWCNHKAFEVAGVDKNTPDITPGSNYFVRDEEGNPTGRCIETCYFHLAKCANYFPSESFKKSVLDFGNKMAAFGYTTFADLGDLEFITNSLDEGFYDFINSDEFPQRFFGGFFFISNKTDMWQSIIDLHHLVPKLKDTDKLGFKVFKMVGDGVLESRSAAMVKAYDNGETISTNFSKDETCLMGLLAASGGYDINVHAIGDATTKMALDMAEVIREAGYDDTRIALSHSECFVDGDIERAGKLGIFINSTGAWHACDAKIYKEYLGVNMDGQPYPIRSLINAGCKYGQGTDCPVSDGDPTPFASIEVGMRRKSIGENGPDLDSISEAITLEESIESWTINNAWQVRMEDKLGSIEEGKLADLVVLDQNLFDIPVTDIHNTKVLETIRGGQSVYKA